MEELGNLMSRLLGSRDCRSEHCVDFPARSSPSITISAPLAIVSVVVRVVRGHGEVRRGGVEPGLYVEERQTDGKALVDCPIYLCHVPPRPVAAAELGIPHRATSPRNLPPGPSPNFPKSEIRI